MHSSPLGQMLQCKDAIGAHPAVSTSGHQAPGPLSPYCNDISHPAVSTSGHQAPGLLSPCCIDIRASSTRPLGTKHKAPCHPIVTTSGYKAPCLLSPCCIYITAPTTKAFHYPTVTISLTLLLVQQCEGAQGAAETLLKALGSSSSTLQVCIFIHPTHASLLSSLLKFVSLSGLPYQELKVSSAKLCVKMRS
eukprot:957852-Pelagomonas_calceolata.AAC.2